MDRLSPLFKHLTPNIDVFFAGNSCENSMHVNDSAIGHLHLVNSGTLLISGENLETVQVSEPSVIFFPCANAHSLNPVHASGVDLLCATISLGKGVNNPLFTTLPPVLIVPVAESPNLTQQTQLLFAEAANRQCGSSAALQLLTEYVLILLLRHVMDTMNMQGCMLSALGDERLSRALTAIHEHPENAWTIESLASLSSMSRARFAHHFRESVGSTPLEYLTDWRISVARKLMLAGEPVNGSALRVGYKSATAFTRAFDRRTGMTPTQWIAANRVDSK